jgi:hypothetical protein
MAAVAPTRAGPVDPLVGALIWGLILAGTLVLVVWAIVRVPGRRTRRLLRRLRRSEVGAAKDGPVMIVGTLKLIGPPLRGPLSKRPCALWDVVVTEWRGQSEDRLIEDRMALDFLVDDGTGVALVRAAQMSGRLPGGHIELAIVQDRKYSSGILEDATLDLEQFLGRYDKKSTGMILNRRLVYREGVFEPGERIAVYGYARREVDPDPASMGDGYRDRPMRLVIEPLGGKIHLSDEPEVMADP